MQVLSHTFTYFSIQSPWTLRHLSYRDTSLLIPSSYQTAAWLFNQSTRQRAAGPHHLYVVYQQGAPSSSRRGESPMVPGPDCMEDGRMCPNGIHHAAFGCVCDKTCIFFFFPIINKYFLMAKRSLLSRCPSYLHATPNYEILYSAPCINGLKN